jgi:transcriptional regulator with XRE-family HTH domain
MPRDAARADEAFGLRMRIAHRHSKHRDLNQTELAKLFKVSPSAMSTWFAGMRVPYDNIIEIARQFEVAADWLLTGREPMRPYPPSPLITLAQDMMMLEKETLSSVFFITRLLQKKVITHSQLQVIIQLVAEGTNGISMN